MVAIGKAQGEGDAKACREYFWQPLRYMPIGRKTGARLYEQDDVALVGPEDQSLFDAVLDSLRITKPAPAGP